MVIGGLFTRPECQGRSVGNRSMEAAERFTPVNTDVRQLEYVGVSMKCSRGRKSTGPIMALTTVVLGLVGGESCRPPRESRRCASEGRPSVPQPGWNEAESRNLIPWVSSDYTELDRHSCGRYL